MQRVRESMGLSQAAMARELRISQPLVCAIEGGASESGPISKLLDLLEAQVSPPAEPNAAGTSAGAGIASPAVSSSARDAA